MPLSNQTPTQLEILRRLQFIVEQRTEIDGEKFSGNAVLADLGVDSFALIDIVFAAEEEFGVMLNLERLRIERVQDFVNALAEGLRAHSVSMGLAGGGGND